MSKGRTVNANVVKGVVLAGIIALCICIVVAVYWLSPGGDSGTSATQQDTVSTQEDPRIQVDNTPVSTPVSMTIDHHGKQTVSKMVSGVQYSDDLSRGDSFWYNMSATPGSRDSGTVVVFTKSIAPATGDTVRVDTDRDPVTYTVDSVALNQSPENPDWSDIGSETFNRTTGDEALVLMVVTDNGYDVVVATPTGEVQ